MPVRAPAIVSLATMGQAWRLREPHRLGGALDVDVDGDVRPPVRQVGPRHDVELDHVGQLLVEAAEELLAHRFLHALDASEIRPNACVVHPRTRPCGVLERALAGTTRETRGVGRSADVPWSIGQVPGSEGRGGARGRGQGRALPAPWGRDPTISGSNPSPLAAEMAKVASKVACSRYKAVASSTRASGR